jgi:pimeloyl-ACP methyl ester carboxylesterase
MAFYGDLFRPPGQPLAVGDPYYRAGDVELGFETELLLAWWKAAAAAEPQVVAPGADTLVRTPGSAQAALRALSQSKFFGGLALRTLVFDLKQVRRYLTDPELRATAQGRVISLIGPDTQVVVGHSLGSVVAYEALHALDASGASAGPRDGRGHRVRALVTLGSPLGIRNLIFDRLQPPPDGDRGAWPGGPGLVWTNVVDAGDVVALVKDLRPTFGDQLNGCVVHNGAHAHDARAYLTDALTGAAIAAGLR